MSHRYPLLALLILSVVAGCGAGEVVTGSSGDGVLGGEPPVDPGIGAGPGSGTADGGNSGGGTDGGASSGSGGPALTGPLTTATYSGSGDDFLNPERGFFTIVDLVNGRDFRSVRANGMSLGHAKVTLPASGPIGDALLSSLTSGFAAARTSGIKIVLRFAYSWSSTDLTPARSVVLGHITQLKPLLQANADVIAVLQAGFIGPWGEWHSSPLSNATDQAAVLNALLDALPASRTVQVRAPAYKTNTFGTLAPLTDDEGFSATPKARTGHHNDCFLASSTDMGTYAHGALSIQQWKDYIAQDANYVPVGGETCAVNAPRTDCPTSVSEMAQLHWSQLNSQYNTSVINGWKTQGCYNEVRRRLGYRLSLLDAAWTPSLPPGGVLELKVHLVNSGFAALYNPRPLMVVLDGPDGRYEAEVASIDPRRFTSGAETTFTTRLRVPAAVPAGTYRLALWLPDAAPALRANAAFSVRFGSVDANGADVWSPSTGLNVLTNAVTIAADASAADVDPSAPRFEELSAR